jgi:branched-chain amino acid transport system permease protein
MNRPLFPPFFQWLKHPKGYLALLVLVTLIIFPQIVQNPFVLHLLIMVLFYAALGGAWNIIGGFAGQLSLGHAAFFGVGAYSCVLLNLYAGLNPWAGMVVGMLITSVFAAAISYPSFRLRGPFFTLVTIAFAEVLRILVIYFKDFTKGSAGITIPQKMGLANFAFREKEPYLYIALSFASGVFLISYFIEKSRFGYHLIALREDEDAAESLGVNTSRTKLKAAVLSAALTSIGGVFYAQYILFIEPYSEFSLDLSIQFALVPMIGGMGTAAGPIIGSFVLTPLQELLRSWLGGRYAGLHLVIYGCILMLVVIFMPQGILGLIKRTLGPREEKSSSPLVSKEDHAIKR